MDLIGTDDDSATVQGEGWHIRAQVGAATGDWPEYAMVHVHPGEDCEVTTVRFPNGRCAVSMHLPFHSASRVTTFLSRTQGLALLDALKAVLEPEPQWRAEDPEPADVF